MALQHHPRRRQQRSQPTDPDQVDAQCKILQTINQHARRGVQMAQDLRRRHLQPTGRRRRPRKQTSAQDYESAPPAGRSDKEQIFSHPPRTGNHRRRHVRLGKEPFGTMCRRRTCLAMCEFELERRWFRGRRARQPRHWKFPCTR